jgi:hypothetical protein
MFRDKRDNHDRYHGFHPLQGHCPLPSGCCAAQGLRSYLRVPYSDASAGWRRVRFLTREPRRRRRRPPALVGLSSAVLGSSSFGRPCLQCSERDKTALVPVNGHREAVINLSKCRRGVSFTFMRSGWHEIHHRKCRRELGLGEFLLPIFGERRWPSRSRSRALFSGERVTRILLEPLPGSSPHQRDISLSSPTSSSTVIRFVERRRLWITFTTPLGL